MADFVETSSKSWFSRIMESIKGVVLGLVMVVGAFPALFVNEGCAVKIAKGLSEGRGQVQEAQAATVNAGLEGKLVHMSGVASSQQGVTDEVLKVKVPGAIRLEREVEMYQWIEVTETKTEKKVGGKEETTKSITYKKEWSSTEHSSANYKIKEKDGEPVQNPPFAIKSGAVSAKDVVLGAHGLSDSLVSQITGGTPVALDASSINALPESLRSRAQLHDNGISIGAPNSPKVGDYRIKLRKTDAADVTVIAKQQGNQLVPWATSQGTTIGLLEKGTKTADEMFSSAEAANTMRTWLVRFGGFLLMLIGFSLIFKPLSTVADVVPFIGSIVSMGTGLVAFALAAPLSLLTIAIAWVAYRPLLGIPLIVLSVGIFVAIFIKSRKKK